MVSLEQAWSTDLEKDGDGAYEVLLDTQAGSARARSRTASKADVGCVY